MPDSKSSPAVAEMNRMFPLLIGMVAATVTTASPTPVACAGWPNWPATTLHVQEPVVPPMAVQQGVAGTVQVVVTLDERSHLTRAAIRSSPSALLNNAALEAARHSLFRTEVRDCKPFASDYIYSVDFRNDGDFGLPPYSFVASSTPPVIVARGEGRMTLTVNAVVVQIEFSALEATAAEAATADDAAFEAFRARFAALAPPLSPPSSQYYNVFPATLPSHGFLASHGIAVGFSRDTPLADLFRTAADSGATSATIAYVVNKGKADIAPAAESALRAATRDAHTLAADRGLRLGALVDSRTVSIVVPTPIPVALGAPPARIAVPTVPRTVDAVVKVAARFAVQP